ncbi:MAG TPA: hypothetical protein VNT99_10295 [Methylomirabilota bacterium]|nr:hypothetical protein [Methylomirabilota bacterium]
METKGIPSHFFFVANERGGCETGSPTHSDFPEATAAAVKILDSIIVRVDGFRTASLRTDDTRSDTFPDSAATGYCVCPIVTVGGRSGI